MTGAIVVMPAAVGLLLALLGSASGRAAPTRSLSGLGTAADDAMTQNLQIAQQYQMSALTGTLVVLGLLAVPVLTAGGAWWLLRKS